MCIRQEKGSHIKGTSEPLNLALLLFFIYKRREEIGEWGREKMKRNLRKAGRIHIVLQKG